MSSALLVTVLAIGAVVLLIRYGVRKQKAASHASAITHDTFETEKVIGLVTIGIPANLFSWMLAAAFAAEAHSKFAYYSGLVFFLASVFMFCVALMRRSEYLLMLAAVAIPFLSILIIIGMFFEPSLIGFFH